MTLSFKFGPLSHNDAANRQQAIDHNIETIALGERLGSRALTVWIGDGSDFPGQTSLPRQFDRYLDAMKATHRALPDGWRIFSEHKIHERAFYSTVVQDWGSSLMIAQELGDKAACLVDLGHRAPNVNIEMIVARLIQAGKLVGFQFNHSKYGDADLHSGTIEPYRLFLVWHELVALEAKSGLDIAHIIDQSHNVTDPIESLMISAMEIERAFVAASLVDRAALAGCQDDNDALMALATLRRGFQTDVGPILTMARLRKGVAIDRFAMVPRPEGARAWDRHQPGLSRHQDRRRAARPAEIFRARKGSCRSGARALAFPKAALPSRNPDATRTGPTFQEPP